MALVIRFTQTGKTNQKKYRLVLTERSNPRDGKFIENLGWYNPHAKDEKDLFLIKLDRVEHWLNLGAQLSDKAECLVKKASPELLKIFFQEKLKRKIEKKKKVKK